MKIIEKTEQYFVIEFDDNDLHEDKDLEIINDCVINDISYEFVDENETQIKIFDRDGDLDD